MVATRRSDKKKAYKAGNRVEILTSEGIAIGQLVKKIALRSVFDNQPRGRESGTLGSNKRKNEVSTRKNEAVDHWLVKLEGEDEDVPFSEHSFGKTLPPPGTIETSESDTSNSFSHLSNPISPAAISSVDLSDKNKQKESTTTARKGAATAVEVVTPITKSSAGSKPSSRSSSPSSSPASTVRQTPPSRCTGKPLSKPMRNKAKVESKQRVNTRSSGQILYTATDNVDTILKRKTTRNRKEVALVKKSVDGEEQSVVKIPMNTGILYLYRGKRRSAKFVPLK